MNPSPSMVFNMVMAVIGVVAVLAPSAFPSYIPPGVVANIIQTAGFVTTLWTGINGAMHAASSSRPGPLGK